jgi:hypothetical protein
VQDVGDLVRVLLVDALERQGGEATEGVDSFVRHFDLLSSRGADAAETDHDREQ